MYRVFMLFVCFIPLPILASHAWQLQLDNDIVTNSDGNYTGGAFVEYRRGLQRPLSWLTQLPKARDAGAQSEWFWNISQQAWTPKFLDLSRPQPDDRPYAGTLMTQLGYHQYSPSLVQELRFGIGIVGPSAQADRVQKYTHKITGSMPVEGWDNQVRDQGLLDLHYRLQYRMNSGTVFSPTTQWELSAYNHNQLGNFRSQLLAGLELRVGEQLSLSYQGLTRARQNWYWFARAEGGYRFNDITIDGDLPYQSEVSVEHMRMGLSSGVQLDHQRWWASFALLAQRRDFEEANHSFYYYGELKLGWRY